MMIIKGDSLEGAREDERREGKGLPSACGEEKGKGSVAVDG